MTQRAKAFVEHLAREGLREVDLAVAVLWYIGHLDSHSHDVLLQEILQFLEYHRLKSGVNASRLSQNLKKDTNVVRGKLPHTFRIKAGIDAKLASLYAVYLEPTFEGIPDAVISQKILMGGRRHLEHIRTDANASFEYGLYNSTAVMCRRLTELLLIEAFHSIGHVETITDDRGEFLGFGEIINKARSGQFLKLSRTSPKALDNIKLVGDTAAHHRYYVTTKQDIEQLNPAMSHLIAELAAMAGY